MYERWLGSQEVWQGVFDKKNLEGGGHHPLHFYKGVKIQSPNITILKKVKPREQVQLFHTSNKNYYHLLILL